jgi:hypothetical protein
MLRSIRRERPLPNIEGDLSSWIFQLHGLTRHGTTQESGGDAAEVQVPPSLVNWIQQVAGPELDLRKIETAVTKARQTKDGIRAEEWKPLYHGDKQEFDSQFSQKAREILDAFSVPTQFPAILQVISFEGSLKMLRATRATMICLAIHEMHPLLLITRASKGDRRATLDLIKVDKLFLHDGCTENVIKCAELMNDHSFLEQLARAQNYQPKLRVREIQHLYFYLLFLLERMENTRLPKGYELWRILDPRAREYDSLDAFERDFQRRRRGFEQIITDIAAEGKKSKQ